jgi:flagellar basal-body rod protein FlgB
MNKLDETLRFHHSALRLRDYRQQVLATNIANADTPNFAARDFDFASVLRDAVDTRNGSMTLSTTASRHISPSAVSIGTAELAYRVPQQASLDGNSVDMDGERMQFADNSVRYEATLTFIGAQLKSVLAALQG